MKILPFTFLFALFSPNLQGQEPSNNELSRRIDLLAEQVENIGIQESGGAVGSVLGMGPAASKVYSAAPGISFGGYGEMLYTGKDAGNTWDFYRAILYAGYRFDDNWVFNSEIEFEHVDEVKLEFAYLDYNDGGGMGYRMGHMLVPMGWINELHEPTAFWSANRPEVERKILPSTWHENGVGAYGEQGDFSWRLYVMNGFDAADLDPSDGMRSGRQAGHKAKAENLALSGRLDWTGAQGWTVGGSFYSGDSNQSTSDTTDFGTTLYDIHMQYDRGPLRLRGLYATAEVNNADLLANSSDSDSLKGWYAEAGYDLWANRGNGTSLTPFVRKEMLDYLVDTAADTERDRTTFGLAYQPSDRVIFKANTTTEEYQGTETDILEVSVGYIL